jgi:hypothetical protein
MPNLPPVVLCAGARKRLLRPGLRTADLTQAYRRLAECTWCGQAKRRVVNRQASPCFTPKNLDPGGKRRSAAAQPVVPLLPRNGWPLCSQANKHVQRLGFTRNGSRLWQVPGVTVKPGATCVGPAATLRKRCPLDYDLPKSAFALLTQSSFT